MTTTTLITAATLVAWFKTHHKDAAEGVFYNGREGGYQYAPGAGPVDLTDTLRAAFPQASDEVFTEAADELLSEAGAWVTKSQY